MEHTARAPVRCGRNVGSASRWALGVLFLLSALALASAWHRTRAPLDGTSERGSGGASIRGLRAKDDETPVHLPKVALLFLTRGPMPLAAIWEGFFEAAKEILHPRPANSTAQPAQQGAISRRMLLPAPAHPGWQALFSIYIHPHPNYTFPNGSLFAPYVVPGRVKVKWGDASEFAAQLVLLRAALADPLNQRFVFLSDSCIPLYPPATVYWQLMSEQRSRVNPCSSDTTRSSIERWSPALLDYNISREGWRKASQWLSLNRKVAEVVAEEAVVIKGFNKHCLASGTPLCLITEHYIPTLLAHLGLEGEAECSARTTHDTFEREPGRDWISAHPKRYTAEEATLETVECMRDCPAPHTWNTQAKRGIAALLQQQANRRRLLLAASPATACQGSDGSSADCSSVFSALAQASGALNITAMPASCPLFARKIAPEAAQQWARVLLPVLAA